MARRGRTLRCRAARFPCAVAASRRSQHSLRFRRLAAEPARQSLRRAGGGSGIALDPHRRSSGACGRVRLRQVHLGPPAAAAAAPPPRAAAPFPPPHFPQHLPPFPPPPPPP